MEDNGKELARYEGSVYGLTLRHMPGEYMKFVVWGFNTSAARDHGYCDGFYSGDYFETLAEAVEGFSERVSPLALGAGAESRAMERKRAEAMQKIGQ